MAITNIAAPLTEPITLDYAKTFLRVDNDDEDQLISDLIVSARLRIEAMIGGSLITRARRYTSGRISSRGVFINHHPISAVTAVRLVGEGSVDIALDKLTINLRCQPPTVTLKARSSWLSFDNEADTLEIDFTAGYGLTVDDVPMPLRQAVLLLLAQSYEFRGEKQEPPSVPMMVDALLMPYRGMRL